MGTIDANGNITLPLGDTFSFYVVANTDYEFADTDRALFTIASPTGNIIFQNAYPLEHGRFRVDLHNGDTDTLSAGTYPYDVRFAINPVYDAEGKIVDADIVNTPKRPRTLTLLSTVGKI